MKFTKNKKFILKNITLVLIIFITAILIQNEIHKYNYINKFINTIQNKKNNEVDLETSKIYKKKILKELKDNRQEKNLIEGYFSLGYIDYINGFYESSNEYFFMILNNNETVKKDILLFIYEGISNNYLALNEKKLSDGYFTKAENLAKELNLNDLLAEMYRDRAAHTMSFSKGVEESIALCKKAMKLNQSEQSIIKNNIELSNIYMSVDDFDKALEYTVDALVLSSRYSMNELKVQSRINLGYNYYIQGNYEKSIKQYNNVLQEDSKIATIDQKMDCFSYIAQSYYKLGLYKEAYKCIDKCIYYANNFHEPEKGRQLNWIYTLLAEIKIEEEQIKEGDVYLKKAKKLYDSNKMSMFNNVELWMEKVEIDKIYKTNKSYDEVINMYINLLNKFEDKGIKDKTKEDIIHKVVEISKVSGDYETALFYTDKIVNFANQKSKSSLNNMINYFQENLENNIMKDEIIKMKLQQVIIISVLICLIMILLIIHNKNKEIKKLNQELKHISITDPLTQVLNKRALYEEFRKIYNNEEYVNFIMMDIDYFKLYNDNYGHIAGDKVLSIISKEISNTFKDSIVARYGGEEFCVISRYKDKNQLVNKLNQLKENIYNLNIKHKYSLISDRITLSIGVESLIINNEEDIKKLMKVADERLYISKTKGRDRYTV